MRCQQTYNCRGKRLDRSCARICTNQKTDRSGLSFFIRLFTTQSLPWEAEGFALVEYFEEEWSAIEEGGGFLQCLYDTTRL